MDQLLLLSCAESSPSRTCEVAMHEDSLSGEAVDEVLS